MPVLCLLGFIKLLFVNKEKMGDTRNRALKLSKNVHFEKKKFFFSSQKLKFDLKKRVLGSKRFAPTS